MQKIFGLKNEEPSGLKDFSLMAVDLHSHLIPAIDDGVKTVEDSIAILKQFEQLGFKKIITTPHVVPDGYNNSSETILRGRDKVLEAMKKNSINIQFEAAAEYYFDGSLNEKIKNNDILTIGKNYVLVEYSYLAKPNDASNVIYNLQVAGYKIILAHPERYPYYHEKKFDSYHALKERKVFFQINLMSLIGRYGKPAKAIAERMIDEKLVDFVGTDLHGMKHLENIKECLSEKYLEKILTYDKLLNKTLL